MAGGADVQEASPQLWPEELQPEEGLHEVSPLCLSALPITSSSQNIRRQFDRGKAKSGALFSASLGASSCQWERRRAEQGSPPSVDLTTRPSQVTLSTCLCNTLCSMKGSRPRDQGS